MHVMIVTSATKAWLQTLAALLAVKSTASPRGQKTRELIGHQLIVDMAQPVVAVTQRQLGYRFMCAEAAWILSGDNRLSTIESYSKTIHKFSDDGVTFFGAYGPKIQAQLESAVLALVNDHSTRQAVINIWHENPPPTADLPCTLNYQFLIRNDQLHLIVAMRSNDVWLGLAYDLFSAVMLAGTVLLKLNTLARCNYTLGSLYHTAGSRHLYEIDWLKAQACLDNPAVDLDCRFNPNSFQCSADLLAQLWTLARLDKDTCKHALAKGLINHNTEPHVEQHAEVWYAVGNGMVTAAENARDAQEIVDAWKAINDSDA